MGKFESDVQKNGFPQRRKGAKKSAQQDRIPNVFASLRLCAFAGNSFCGDILN